MKSEEKRGIGMRKKLLTLIGIAAIAAEGLPSPVRSGLGTVPFEDDETWIPSASDYITDGLIRQLDSMETIGYGIEEHSGGTYLYNLATSVRSGIKIDANATWDGNWIVMTSSLSNNVFADTSLADLTYAFQNDSWTLEFCGILSSAVGCFDNSENKYGWGLCGIANHKNIGSLGIYGGGVRVLVPWEFDSPSHFSLVRDGEKCYFYVNGILYTSFTATVNGVIPNLRKFYIYAGTVMGSYRFYDSALSSDEIFFNHIIDARRFGL